MGVQRQHFVLGFSIQLPLVSIRLERLGSEVEWCSRLDRHNEGGAAHRNPLHRVIGLGDQSPHV